MIEATSCGGVVIFRGKILLLYKNLKNKYDGWMFPKGTVEPGEDYEDTAIREVKEESGADARIVSYVGRSTYTFSIPQDVVDKEVHWYLMISDSYYSKPQKRSTFVTPDIISITRHIIFLSILTRGRYLRKHMHSILNLRKGICGEHIICDFSIYS